MSQECLMSGCQRKFSMENCKKESAHKVAKRNTTKTPIKPRLRIFEYWHRQEQRTCSGNQCPDSKPPVLAVVPTMHNMRIRGSRRAQRPNILFFFTKIRGKSNIVDWDQHKQIKPKVFVW